MTAKRFGLAVVALLAIVIGGPRLAAAQTLADIKTRGTINVGMLVDFPPFGIMNAENQPDGYDADVAKALAKSLGVKVNLVPVTGPNRIPYLLGDRVDVLIASLGITAERAQKVAFSNPYADIKIAVFGKRDLHVAKAADLAGQNIGVARASTQDVIVSRIAPPGTNIQRFDDDASAVQALLSGQVPLIGCSNTVSAQIDKVAPGQFDVKFDLQKQVQGIAVKPGSADLLKAVNEFITEAKKDGELDAIHRKWLGTPAPDDLGQPMKP